MDAASASPLASKIKETKALISELCRQFYHLGWLSGTGGSITIKVHDHSIPKSHQLIVMSPSGVQKERIMEEDMYVLSPDGSVLYEPLAKPWPHMPPKCSDCGPVFMKAYEMCNAGAVIHSHGLESCLITMINPSSNEFRISHMEMIKGIEGHSYYDELIVPIIENTAHENELTEPLAKAIKAYPKTTAVLVRNHGVFVWGDSWISAKTQAECYHYLFDAAVKLHQYYSAPSHDSILGIKPSRRCILLDIERTTTPISFISNVLFRYARDSVGKYLESTYDTAETRDDIKYLRSQAMIKADRKVTVLKQFQGHIWRTGFQKNELEAIVFDDVPKALEKWHSLGIKVYVYSSINRLTQRLLFGNTNYGDLRKFLSGFFDNTMGNKTERKSYIEISECLGVNSPSEILFVTSVYQEAMAAKTAGLEVVIVIRPGNGPLPENHGFRTIESFSNILEGL